MASVFSPTHPQIPPIFPILRVSERVLYSAHTYTLVCCYSINVPTNRLTPDHQPTHPARPAPASPSPSSPFGGGGVRNVVGRGRTDLLMSGAGAARGGVQWHRGDGGCMKGRWGGAGAALRRCGGEV